MLMPDRLQGCPQSPSSLSDHADADDGSEKRCVRLGAGVIPGWAIDYPIVVIGRAARVALVPEILGGRFGLRQGPKTHWHAVPSEKRFRRTRGVVREAAHDVEGHEAGLMQFAGRSQ